MDTINLTAVPAFYHKYIQLVQMPNLDTALHTYPTEVSLFLQHIPEAKWEYRYAPGKWSIKEMVQHIMDADRIFCYRALCIARGEKSSLPGFDENLYAAHSKADRRTKDDLLQEMQAVHNSTRTLFLSFDEEQLNATGTANNNPIYVKAIGAILIGHALHHKNILQERYL